MRLARAEGSCSCGRRWKAVGLRKAKAVMLERVSVRRRVVKRMGKFVVI